MEKKLYRSRTNKKIAGVCGGLVEYLGLKIDTNVIRLIWALLCLGGGIGLLAYIVCALVIPEKPDDDIIDVE